jgi:hypothetical protein
MTGFSDPTKELVYKSLDLMMRTCGFSGETGTEAFFKVLERAMSSVGEQWDEVVGQSHRDGLAYDVNAMLANEIAKAADGYGLDH